MFSSPEWSGQFTRAVRFFLLFFLTCAFGVCPGFALPQATDSPVPSIPIIVTDFELFSMVPRAASPAAPAATPSTKPVATPSATPVVTPPATPIATPPATPTAPTSTTPIATPPAAPINTTPPAPIATASATPSNTPPATPPAASSRQKPPPLINGDTDLPSVQARRLTDFFSETLLQMLQKKGYNAARASGQNPSSGALIRGVFAEADAKNRIRRSIWGGTSSNTRFLLYVGIFNLARPDQPLYQLAAEQPGGSQFGPVITLNNYIPLAKYELDKNPTEEDVRKICGQIAASLAALLSANPNAFAQ